MPTPRSAQDVLVTELKEIYSAERQLVRATPRILRRVKTDRLKSLIETRRERGQALIEELDRAFEEMQVAKARPKNVAAEGLLDDVNEHLEEIEDPVFLEPVLIGGLQKLEHYCIAAWGTARSLGDLLDQTAIVEAMKRAVDDGAAYDEELTTLAEDEVNPKMTGGRGGRSGSNDADDEDDELGMLIGDAADEMAEDDMDDQDEPTSTGRQSAGGAKGSKTSGAAAGGAKGSAAKGRKQAAE